MGNWGDEWDPEVINKKEPEGRFTINFKKVFMDLEAIVDGTLTVNEKHPKNELIKEWAGVIVGFFIMFLLAYKAFAFAALPFMIFYIICLVKLAKAWKHFGYKLGLPIVITLLLLVGLLALALYLHRFYPL